jgi:hypothetical protein
MGMAGGRKDVLDIREIVRCLKLGRSIREISRDLEIHRKTVREYRKLTHSAGWLDQAELPSLAEIQATGSGLSKVIVQQTVEYELASDKEL